jgi:hypothetical protein
MNTFKHKSNLNNSIILNDEERNLILGTLLGDGFIQKRNDSFRLKIEHSETEKNLVLWKHNILKRLCNENAVKTICKKNGEKTVVFYTKSGLWLKEIHELFYKFNHETNRYVKTITPECVEKLPKSNILVAVWFLDDGSIRKDCCAGKIATQGFSLEENHLLCAYLHKWHITCQIVPVVKKKQQYYISIPAKQFCNFLKIIEFYVRQIPELNHLLNEKTP